MPCQAPGVQTNAVETCRGGVSTPGNGCIVMVLRVEGGSLVVMDAQGGESAREDEGFLQLQLGPLDVIRCACTAICASFSIMLLGRAAECEWSRARTHGSEPAG